MYLYSIILLKKGNEDAKEVDLPPLDKGKGKGKEKVTGPTPTDSRTKAARPRPRNSDDAGKPMGPSK